MFVYSQKILEPPYYNYNVELYMINFSTISLLSTVGSGPLLSARGATYSFHAHRNFDHLHILGRSRGRPGFARSKKEDFWVKQDLLKVISNLWFHNIFTRFYYTAIFSNIHSTYYHSAKIYNIQYIPRHPNTETEVRYFGPQ